MEALVNRHSAQTLAYLKAARVDPAMLMNFGEPSLRVLRFVSRELKINS